VVARHTVTKAEELQALYEAKASAELTAADGLVPGSEAVRCDGYVLARTMLVKGRAGDEDVRSGRALAGRDGSAAEKALEALEIDPGSVFATISRSGDEADEGRLGRLALQIEAVDPERVIALDAEAAEDVASVAELDGLPFGEPVAWRGRTLLAVDGLERSLGSEEAKLEVWRQFKGLAR
jgi:hypothetical protein